MATPWAAIIAGAGLLGGLLGGKKSGGGGLQLPPEYGELIREQLEQYRAFKPLQTQLMRIAMEQLEKPRGITEEEYRAMQTRIGTQLATAAEEAARRLQRILGRRGIEGGLLALEQRRIEEARLSDLAQALQQLELERIRAQREAEQRAYAQAIGLLGTRPGVSNLMQQLLQQAELQAQARAAKEQQWFQLGQLAVGLAIKGAELGWW